MSEGPEGAKEISWLVITTGNAATSPRVLKGRRMYLVGSCSGAPAGARCWVRPVSGGVTNRLPSVVPPGQGGSPTMREAAEQGGNPTVRDGAGFLHPLICHQIRTPRRKLNIA